MPSLNDRRVVADPIRYKMGSAPAPQMPSVSFPPAPMLPSHLTRSPVMLSSLPAIATNVDGITRQFYNPRGLPQRRLSQNT
jgi:hypothetical protein